MPDFFDRLEQASVTSGAVKLHLDVIEVDKARPTVIFVPVKLRVDRHKREVIATVFGGHENRTVYRDGMGCTLVIDTSDEELSAQAKAAPPTTSPLSDDLPWPRGEAVDLDNPPPETDRDILD